jgi:hypothetical protein
LDQSSYNRKEPKDESASHDSKKVRPIEEKESFRWLETGTAKWLAACGRVRWKIENEHNNVLKNHGYNLEHNFGHRRNHGSENFCLLNLPAFLFHTILFLGDEQYRAAWNRFGRRDEFFNALRYTFCRFLHENWDAFILFVWGDGPDG